MAESDTAYALIDYHHATVSVDGTVERDGRVMGTVIDVAPNHFGIKRGDRLHFAKFGGDILIACWD